MTGPWVVRLAPDAAHTLAVLRDTPGVSVGQDEGFVWLRGNSLDDRLHVKLRQLPGAERFSLDEQGRLTPLGKQVPSGRLPELVWRPLREWLAIEPPRASFAVSRVPPVALQVVRDFEPRDANLLLTSLGAWRRFGETAARVRLQPLRFAIAADGRVLVRGQPLPPLPGVRFVERTGVAVQAGWCWQPAVDAAVVRECLRLDGDDLALFDGSGALELIAGEAFIHATRAAIRLSTGPGS